MSRFDRSLRVIQSRGMRRGVMGGSWAWFWVFVAAWTARRIRRVIGSEPVVVYRGEVKPGHTIEVGHLLETYGGKKVRRR